MLHWRRVWNAMVAWVRCLSCCASVRVVDRCRLQDSSVFRPLRQLVDDAGVSMTSHHLRLRIAEGTKRAHVPSSASRFEEGIL
jgi:hypothetical protein